MKKHKPQHSKQLILLLDYEHQPEEDEYNSCLCFEEIAIFTSAFPTPVQTIINSYHIPDNDCKTMTFEEIAEDSELVQKANSHMSQPASGTNTQITASIYHAAMRDIRFITTFNPIERNLLSALPGPSILRKYKDIY